MAFLRSGEYAAIKERCDLIRKVQALYPRPRHSEGKKARTQWLIKQNAIESMSNDQLVRTLQRHKTEPVISREERRIERYIARLEQHREEINDKINKLRGNR